jgi:hypothetical protein
VSRLYKTKTGTYKDTDLVVVVWKNPKKSKRPQSRSLETMSAPSSSFPMAFPLLALKSHYAWKEAKHIKSSDDFDRSIEGSSREFPLILDLQLATAALGWNDFYVPDEYTEFG